jgi:endoglucanase
MLKTPHQVVYSVHEYDTNVYDFGANDQPSTLVPHMNNDRGYLYARNIAPVWVGEMGSNLTSAQDRIWAQTILDYMNGKDGAQGGPAFQVGSRPLAEAGGYGSLSGRTDGRNARE